MPQMERSQLMARVRSRDTAPELAFRQAISARRFRFATYDKSLEGKPDLVFPKHRLAVFIDGDFWHGNQWQKRGFTSVAEQFSDSPNAKYWIGKISRNVERDFMATSAILSSGWSVLRFWESDVKYQLEECVEMTIAAIKDVECRTQPTVLPERKAIELFAGIGLVRLALERCGWNVVFANDNDEKKAEIYRENFGGEHLSTADVRSLTADDLPDAAILTASFPCNDLSIAGAWKGLDGDHSGMFWHVIRLLEELGARKPPFVLLENVVGFLMSHKGKDFETALLALNELGYCVDAVIVDASHFTPQSRARLFIIGKQTSQHSFLMSDSDARPPQLRKFIQQHSHIAWDLRPLPNLPKSTVRLKDIVEDLPADDPLWWNAQRTEYFMSQLSDRHAEVAAKMIAGRKHHYATAFRRVRNGRSMAELRSDGIAGCLRTPRGGSGRQILFKAGYGKHAVRLLSARECARLQGVPDNYKINVTLNQALFGFGDAVCVPAVQWIVENYLIPETSALLRGSLMSGHP